MTPPTTSSASSSAPAAGDGENDAARVPFGADQGFTISPDVGQKIKDVKVNGASVGAVPTYTMKNVTADGSIEATFEPSGGGGDGGGGGGEYSAGYAFLALLRLLPLALRMKK